MKVVTSVKGTVPSARWKDFEAEYRKAKEEPPPQGLEMSFLLRKGDGSGIYTIETIWSSREMLQAMRSKEKPKAVALFEDVGVSPTIEIHELADSIS